MVRLQYDGGSPAVTHDVRATRNFLEICRLKWHKKYKKSIVISCCGVFPPFHEIRLLKTTEFQVSSAWRLDSCHQPCHIAAFLLCQQSETRAASCFVLFFLSFDVFQSPADRPEQRLVTCRRWQTRELLEVEVDGAQGGSEWKPVCQQ